MPNAHGVLHCIQQSRQLVKSALSKVHTDCLGFIPASVSRLNLPSSIMELGNLFVLSRSLMPLLYDTSITLAPIDLNFLHGWETTGQGLYQTLVGSDHPRWHHQEKCDFPFRGKSSRPVLSVYEHLKGTLMPYPWHWVFSILPMLTFFIFHHQIVSILFHRWMSNV